MNVGSLFSGIGGLDLGLERAGMDVIWQSEIDPYASKVLAKHWPTVPNLGDITTIDWSTVERPDVICGGYPCQPFSLAGVRRGEADPRHLWPRFRDALRVLRPRWALLENVPGHLSLGFGRVLGDLAELGYDTEWDCIPAAAVGAPHLRYRVFVVAHTDDVGSQGRSDTRSSEGVGGTRDEPARSGTALHGRPVAAVSYAVGDVVRQQPVSVGRSSGEAVVGDAGTPRHVANTAGLRLPPRPCTPRPGATETASEPHRPGGCPGRDHHWAVEPDVGRVAHGVPNRVDRLRTLGNAVVPQVAELIGRALMAAAA